MFSADDITNGLLSNIMEEKIALAHDLLCG